MSPGHISAKQSIAWLRMTVVGCSSTLVSLGKTSVCLAAFKELRAQLIVCRMFVVAPLRVARSTWPAEVAKWDEFRDLRVQLVHGPKKAEALERPADIYLMNPEGLRWLARRHFMAKGPAWGQLPDMLVVDESTKFKSPGATRSAAMLRIAKRFGRRYILTGTPAPNGYVDLFNQIRLLDEGAALGRRVEDFNQSYMVPVRNDFGWDWELRTDAPERIEKAIAPLILRMDAEELLDLPELVEIPISVQLPPAARRLYQRLEDDMVAQMPQGDVTVAGAGALTTKCRQVANGRVYLDDLPGSAPQQPDGQVRGRGFAAVHDEKAKAVADLVEDLGGKPVLVLYHFAHDAVALRKALGGAPDLGEAGRESAEEQLTMEARWNAGKIPVALAEVSSVAHGLNLQTGGNRLVFYGLTWDLEIYKQVIARLRRPGQQADRVLVYHVMAEDTIDARMSAALRRKDASQQGLLDALKGERT